MNFGPNYSSVKSKIPYGFKSPAGKSSTFSKYLELDMLMKLLMIMTVLSGSD